MKKFARKVLCSLLVVLTCFASVSVGGIGAAAVNVTDGTTYITANDLSSGYIEFGSYPQTRITDEDELNALLLYSVEHVSEFTWISYGYYSGTGNYGSMKKDEEIMRYADVTIDGVKYRYVDLIKYRPCWTINESSADNSSQDGNGYTAPEKEGYSICYIFKFEPLKWRVLNKETGLIICDSMIDSQAFNNTAYITYGEVYDYDSLDHALYKKYYYSDAAHTHYANDYATSSIRTWLNNDFYNTAFSSVDKTAVATSKIGSNNDKIFLLSETESTSKEYGSTNLDTPKGTDYARCQGLSGNYWLTRTSYTTEGFIGNYVRVFDKYNDFASYTDAYNTATGIRPVLKLNLHTHDFTYKENIIYDSTHTSVGYKTCYCRCGAKYTMEIPKKTAHTYTVEKSTPATCTTAGSITYKCACGSTYSKTVAALGHDDVYTIIKEATATEPGKRKHTCTRCSLNVTEDIPVIGSVLKVSVGDVKLDYKASATLKPEITNSGKVSYTVTYSSDSSNVTVDANGKIYGAKKGSANITVTVTDKAGNIASDTCKVEVSYTWWQWIIKIVLFGWIWY